MLETQFLGVNFSNPTVLASGILFNLNAQTMIEVIEVNGAGAVTTKSFSLKPREGHKHPVMQKFDAGFINAVGLKNPGMEEMIKEIKEFKKKCSAPIIASVFAERISDFGEIVEKTSEAEPEFIELNISCPNVEEEFGKPFACSRESAVKVTETAKDKTKIPLIVKLSPNVEDITAIGKAVEEAGADAVNAINTVGPGMLIDLKQKKPVLTNKFGGVSGKAIKPVMIASVWKLYEKINIPILATGGITTGEDAVEALMAGAQLIGVGSALYYRGNNAFKLICSEMQEWMKENNYSNIKELVGIAHEAKK
ncbi:MAG: dihydroorotate dehydrogenase [Candidatus Diapherotrites archaeon]